MKTLYSDRPLTYDGRQLSPHFIYREFGLLGDALVCFEGPADVALDHMVDLEDVRKKAPIYSPKMLHFLGEWFTDNFEWGILLQHHLVAEFYEILLERGVSKLSRRGNDAYFEGRKINVSICTRSKVSILVHVGINIETENTPIPTSGLFELGVRPVDFGKEVLERFSRDYEIWKTARVKVQPR